MADLPAFLEAELDRFGVPGGAVAVVRDGDVVMARGFGHRDVAGELPVTEKTLFPIGSTTKSFTATVVASLVDEGTLEWDRPVRSYIPSFELADPLTTRDVTLRDMLSHRTGIPGHDLVWMMGGLGDVTRAELVERLRHLEMDRSLREAYRYSNLMYTAAGHVAEVVAGKTWEALVSERILGPLDMARTNFTLDELVAAHDRSLGYAEQDGAVVEVPLRRQIATVAPAGCINSTIMDIAAWLAVNVNGGSRAGTRVISEASAAALLAVTTPMPEDSLPWPESRLVGYGLGWVVEYLHGRKLVWHNGGIDGFKAIVAFMPNEKAGVAVLTNRFPTLAPEAIAHDVLTELLGLEAVSWGERFHDLEVQAATAASAAEVVPPPPATPPSRPVAAFAGLYEHPGYGVVAFVADGDELRAELPGLDIAFNHRRLDVWDAKERVHGIGLSFNFLSDLDGGIDRVEAHLESAPAPVVFTRVPTATPR